MPNSTQHWIDIGWVQPIRPLTTPSLKGGLEQATLLGVVLCLLTALFRYRPARAVKYFPGPKPLPLVGNVIYFSKVLRNVEVELPLMAKRFGGLCMLWIGSKPTLVISSLQDAHEILEKRGAVTANRLKKNIFLDHAVPNFVGFAQVGDELRFFRRLYTDLLSQKEVQLVRKYQDYESKIALRSTLDTPDQFLSDLTRMSMSIIFSAVYGVRISRLDHPVIAEFDDIWDKFLSNAQAGHLIIDWLPFLQRLPLRFQPWVTLADSLAARNYKVHMAFLTMLKKQLEAGLEPVCFGTGVIERQKEQGFTDDVAVGVLAGIILAGAESSATMEQSFIKIMALNPEVQKKAQEEIDQVVGHSRLPTWEDQANLPYVRALIKELHRYSPILSFGTPHASTEEIVYQGRTIPSATLILPSTDSLHRDPARYSHPEEFQPERFLGDDLDAFASAKHPDYLKRDHINYGFGRRMCQGIYFAENSLFIAISRYLWAFNITPRPGEPPLRMSDIQETMTRRPNPFKVDMTPRSDEILEVIRMNAEEAHTDIPDVDSIEMAD